MFNAIQVYDIFLKDKQAGIDKYFEAVLVRVIHTRK